jgi:hypothetical protein
MPSEDMLDLLLAVQRGGVTVSSNLAREKAPLVAMAASSGLITTKIHMNVYGREWKLTVSGLTVLETYELCEETDASD